MRDTLLFLSLAVLAITACSKPAPLTGVYKAEVGALEFATTTHMNIRLSGSSRWSGEFYEAKYERNGNDLTVSTKERGLGEYTNIYYFKVIDDGDLLRLVKMKSLDKKTLETESQDTPDNDGWNFSKVLSQ